MASRIRIFDHFCKPLAELQGIPTTPRSWLRNEFGKCEFSIGFDASLPQDSQILKENVFQFGNLIFIEHIPQSSDEGKLPDWVGILYKPRNWDLGVCHLVAYSAEAIFKWRAMPYEDVKGTPAFLFQKIISHANERARNIRFQLGVVDDLPITLGDRLSLNAYDHITDICVKRAGMDWDITGSVNNKGQLELTANLYIRRGDITPFSISNRNSEQQGMLLSEQGAIVNQVFGYSDAWTDQSRFGTSAINQESFDNCGSFQVNQVFTGARDLATIQSASRISVNRGSESRKTFRRTVINIDNSFDHLRVGNIITVKDNNVGFNPNGGYGFESQARILSIDYNDLSDRAPVNLEVLD